MVHSHNTRNLLPEAQAMKSRLVELRRAIHQRPELGFDVYETAALVTRTLQDAGISVHNHVGKSGVIAEFGADGSPLIAIRADMDALPIVEENDVPYVSQKPGMMHACGHDAHTAIAMGVGLLLSGKSIPGRIRLIFQPSEEGADAEGLSGAPRMITDGAMQGVDAVIALHVSGHLESGKVSVQSGAVAAAVDAFYATIYGHGGHGAEPHHTIDPLFLTAQVLNAIYAVPSRRISPFDPCVITVGSVHGGSASNIIPESVQLTGTIRSMDETVRKQLATELDHCFQIVRAFGGDYHLDIKDGYPVMYNSEKVAGVIHQTAVDVLGAENFTSSPATMGSEDFSYMTSLKPGAMFDLGVRKPGTEERMAHSTRFDIDEEALPIGLAVMAETALRLMDGSALN